MPDLACLNNLPQELFDKTVEDLDYQTLFACSRVSRSFRQPCRRRMFHHIRIGPPQFSFENTKRQLDLDGARCHAFYDLLSLFPDIPLLVRTVRIEDAEAVNSVFSSLDQEKPRSWMFHRRTSLVLSNTLDLLENLQTISLSAPHPNLADPFHQLEWHDIPKLLQSALIRTFQKVEMIDLPIFPVPLDKFPLVFGSCKKLKGLVVSTGHDEPSKSIQSEPSNTLPISDTAPVFPHLEYLYLFRKTERPSLSSLYTPVLSMNLPFDLKRLRTLGFNLVDYWWDLSVLSPIASSLEELILQVDLDMEDYIEGKILELPPFPSLRSVTISSALVFPLHADHPEIINFNPEIINTALIILHGLLAALPHDNKMHDITVEFSYNFHANLTTSNALEPFAMPGWARIDSLFADTMPIRFPEVERFVIQYANAVIPREHFPEFLRSETIKRTIPSIYRRGIVHVCRSPASYLSMNKGGSVFMEDSIEGLDEPSKKLLFMDISIGRRWKLGQIGSAENSWVFPIYTWREDIPTC